MLPTLACITSLSKRTKSAAPTVLASSTGVAAQARPKKGHVCVSSEGRATSLTPAHAKAARPLRPRQHVLHRRQLSLSCCKGRLRRRSAQWRCARGGRAARSKAGSGGDVVGAAIRIAPAAEPAISLEGIDGVRAVLARLKLEQYVEALRTRGRRADAPSDPRSRWAQQRRFGGRHETGPRAPLHRHVRRRSAHSHNARRLRD